MMTHEQVMFFQATFGTNWPMVVTAIVGVIGIGSGLLLSIPLVRWLDRQFSA